MKKLSLILLILIYSVSTIGVGVSEFYCCGKLTSVTVTLVDAAKEKCNNSGCCQSKHQFLQVKDKHFASAHLSLPLKHSIALLPATSFSPSVTLISQQINIINGSHAPPSITGVPIYIANCVFRI